MADTTDGKKSLALDTLVGFEWKVGVALQSSRCKDLGAPFVSVVLRLRDPSSGDVVSHGIEMSISEFQVFHEKQCNHISF